MRPLVVVMSLIVAAIVLPEQADSRSGSDLPRVTVYDSNPSHLWNRLYATLIVREDRFGNVYGEDSLDPLLWGYTKFLLEPDSHRRALKVLDEFLQTHGENLIRDPLKRVMMQRDLWAVFDWSVARQPAPGPPKDGRYEAEKRELQVRLAEVLRRLALTREEIESLPDSYSQAVAAEQFAKEYDPQDKDRAFLPADLFAEHGPWVPIDQGYTNPVAIQHVAAFSGRSRFLVFIRLPAGRKATYDYFRQVWDFPQPWTAPSGYPNQTEINPDLPSFPAGTEVALLRQMMLFDKQGNLVPAPITESVQIRVYERVTGISEQTFDEQGSAGSGQNFHELRLSRPLFFSNRSGGLRVVGPDERELLVFNAQGVDVFEIPKFRLDLTRQIPTLRECAGCHRGAGVRSLNSRENLLKPNPLRQDYATSYSPTAHWWRSDVETQWKETRFDWGLLRGYWAAADVR